MCAAAARGLLTGVFPSSVRVPLPPQFDHSLDIPAGSKAGENPASAGTATVVKDGGDDPDATHNLLFEASAFFAPQPELPETSPPIELGNGLILHPGPGIGRVTLPGLPVPPGEAAINPVPRAQIGAALRETLDACGFSGEVHIYLSVPEGANRAGRTLNSRLGILGGISILGTSGIVRPYSHAAWQAVIAQASEQALALGQKTLVFSTGRRSEKALQGLYPELAEQCFIQAADYAAFAVREACRVKAERVIWGCFSGKLLKLAQGMEWTHAKNAETDLKLLRGIIKKHHGSGPVPPGIEQCPTARGIFDALLLNAPETAGETAAELADMAFSTLSGWIKNSRSGERPELELVLLKPDGGLWMRRPETPQKRMPEPMQ